MRLRLTSDWSNVGVDGVGGKQELRFVATDLAVVGVGGRDVTKRLSVGEMGTTFKRI